MGNNCATDPNCHTDGTNTFTVSEWYDAPNRVRATNNVTRNIVSTTGLNGVVFKDFAWDAHYTHGETRLSTTGIHNGNNQFHDAAQDAVVDTDGSIKCWNNTAAAIAQFGDLYPGCVPINTFGYNVTTDAQYNYWARSTHFSETNIMDDIAADISGSLFHLPAGPVKVALAGEMRWLDYTIDSNASPTAVVNCTGLRLCAALGLLPNGKPAQQPGTGFITAANSHTLPRPCGTTTPCRPSTPRRMCGNSRAKSASRSSRMFRWSRAWMPTSPAATPTTASPARLRPGRSVWTGM